MCCYLPRIPELEKKADSWCIHCSSHQHCDQYTTRPNACRSFFCFFMLQATLDEAWRPSTARFMMKNSRNQLFVLADPNAPDAWRQEPYFSNLQAWSAQYEVTISIGARKLALFPDHIDDLGPVAEDEVVAFLGRTPEPGSHFRAIKVKKIALPPGPPLHQ